MEPAAIVLYDSDCIMCSRFTQFVLQHEKEALIYFSPIRSPLSQTIKEKYHLSDNYAESIVFIEDHRAYSKSAAVFNIAKHLKFPYRFLYYLSFISIELVNNFLYDLISKNRYRILGRRNECEQINPQYKHRFI